MKYKTLAQLSEFSEGVISAINIGGDVRRRLLDLGFSNGNRVVPLFKSPLGDPTAYYIMGSIVALRNNEAEKILITDFERKGEI